MAVFLLFGVSAFGQDKVKVAEFVLGSFRAGREALVSGEFEVSFKGNVSCAGDRVVVAFESGFEKLRFDRHLRIPVGTSYASYFVQLPDRTLHAYEHSSAVRTGLPDELPDAGVGVFDVRTLGLMCFAENIVGIAHPELGELMTFPNILERSLDPHPHVLEVAGYKVSVSVLRAEKLNEKEYVIEFRQANPVCGQAVESIVFDASKTFVPVRRVFRDLPTDAKTDEMGTQVDEVEWVERGGIWVPSKCKSVSDGRTLTALFSWSTVNQDVPDEHFLLPELTPHKFQIDSRLEKTVVTARPETPETTNVPGSGGARRFLMPLVCLTMVTALTLVFLVARRMSKPR